MQTQALQPSQESLFLVLIPLLLPRLCQGFPCGCPRSPGAQRRPYDLTPTSEPHTCLLRKCFALPSACCLLRWFGWNSRLRTAYCLSRFGWYSQQRGANVTSPVTDRAHLQAFHLSARSRYHVGLVVHRPRVDLALVTVSVGTTGHCPWSKHRGSVDNELVLNCLPADLRNTN